MAVLSKKTREIKAKIVYYGPGLGGKTTNIQYIFKKMRPDHRGSLTTLSDKRDRTLYFDFLPVELGAIKGFKTRLHIFTVPGQVFYNATRKAVLKDVDGIVFVADSQIKLQDDNIRSIRNLEDNLREYGRSLKEIPHILQYNKRDLPDIMSIEEMHRDLNKYNVPFFEAKANTGSGVLNTLKLISKMVLKKLSDMSSFKDEDEVVDETGQVYGLGESFVPVNPAEEAQAASNPPVEAVPPPEEEPVVEASEPVIEDAQPVDDEIQVEATEVVEPDEHIEEAPGEQWTPDNGETAEEPVNAEEEVIEEEHMELVEEEPEAPEVEIEEEPSHEETEAAEEFWGGETGATAAPEAGAVDEPPVDDPIVEEPEDVPEEVPPTLNTSETEKANEAVPGTLKVYQWGTPETGENNTLKIPLYFQDPKTGAYYYTSVTISLEPLIKTG